MTSNLLYHAALNPLNFTTSNGINHGKLMKKKLFFSLLLSTLCVGSIFVSCKKDKQEDLEYDTQTSQDNALAEGIFNDVNNIDQQAVDNGSGGLSTYRSGENHEGAGILSTCAQVSVTPDSTGTGGTLTVDFGSTNCLCYDLRYRRGVINVHYSGLYRDSGTVITTTFTDYYVGFAPAYMFHVEGTKTVTNEGHNSAGHLVYSISVNGQITNYNNEVMTWTSNRQREWTEGENTTGWSGWLDDVYVITGSANGTNFEGNAYTANITSGLEVALDCRWIRKGIFELTPAGKPTRTLDYGNGGCDSLATVSVNGISFNIVLR